jgi:Ca-activated chloride channel family protein
MTGEQTMLVGIVTAMFTLFVPAMQAQTQPQEQQAAPRFRSSVDIVSVAAVVRDRKGRFVTDLSKKDFQIVEAGQPRDILDFRAEVNGPVKLAVLMDVSGSMRMAQRTSDSRRAAEHIFANLATADEAAVFSFDTMLAEVQTFTTDREKLQASLSGIDPPFGQTSLYDAIASTARMVADASRSGPRGLPQRSAVVVITDGVDTRSRMSAAEVSVAASGIDVPVYIFAVVASVDDPRENEDERRAAVASNLQELARNTGGELLISSSPAQASVAARQIISELRHQYVLAFEATARTGWRSLEVRTRKDGHVVRARSGYNGATPASNSENEAAGAAVSGPATVRMGSGRS